jgi:uroporphyrinogen decarboxylase
MNEKMTSRERVRRAINHQEPDRVPIDIGGTSVTSIHIDEYIEIGEYLGLDIQPTKVYEQFLMLARVDELMMKWLHADVIHLENVIETWGFENKNWKVWTTNLGNDVLMPGSFNPVKDDKGYLRLYDVNGKSMAIMAPNGLYFDRDCPTKMSTGDLSLMDPRDWGKSIPLYSEEELRILEKRSKFLYENTDYSVHGGFFKGALGTSGIFAGQTIGDWMCILISEKDYANSILRATAERAVQNLELYLQAVGKYIDTIMISGTDFGGQYCEVYDPEIFKDLHRPNYKLINDYVHNNSKVKTMFHSCGSIFNIIEYFIDAGVDILNPVQTNTSNMEPEKLKQKFGDRIVFWGGGVETQTVLPFGTKEEVIEQVKERVRIFGNGGGFVFAPVHNIQYGVPPQNVEAMIEAVMKYGVYPNQSVIS